MSLLDPPVKAAPRERRPAQVPRGPAASGGSARSSPLAHALHAVSARRESLAAGAALPAQARSAAERVVAAPGESLWAPQRARFEHRLGTGLGDVRVHADADAARSVRLLDARAYAVGPHIVLGRGSGSAIDAVLGHELVHVVQQRGASRVGPLELVPAHHPTEREAAALRPGSRLSRQAVQRIQQQPATARPGTGGALLLTLQLQGQLMPMFLNAFLDGLAQRLVLEEMQSERATKALQRLRWVQNDPRFMLGSAWGFVQGLFSPITDLFQLFVLGHDVQRAFVDWALTRGVSLVTGPAKGGVATQALDLGVSLVQLNAEITRVQGWVVTHPLEAAHLLGSIADDALPGALMKANDAGSAAAGEMLTFAELPAFDLGEKLGYVAGSVVVEALLLVFTEAIGNAIRSGLRALARLGSLGRTATRAIITAIRAVRETFALVRAAIGAAWHWLTKQFRKLFALLEEVLAKALRLADTIAKDVGEQVARARGAVVEGFEALGPRLAPAAGPALPSALMKSGEEAASDVAARGRKEAVQALYPEKVHPTNLEARAAKEGGGARGPTEKPPVAPTIPRSTLEYVEALQGEFPQLRNARLGAVPRDTSLPGLFDESVRTGSGRFSFEVTFEGRPLQLDDIAPDGRIIDVKMRDTGRTFWGEPGGRGEHVPDVVEQMERLAGTGKPPPPRMRYLPEKNEAQLARQVRFAREHGLPGVIWQTNVEWMGEAIRRTAARRGWTGFVIVEVLE